ncbi:MAG: SPOR domain-containing protein, partial [Hyphomicrobium sp.]
TLLGSYAGTDGIKTGYTRASGFNLVSSVRRDGRHVVAAVFGGSSAASRNAHMRLLLNRALTQASAVKTRKPMLIAKPKLAPRPQPAAVAVAAVIKPAEPKRNPVTVAAATAPPVRTQASLPPAAAWSAETQNAPAGEPAAAPVRFEIAKVRRVMVAPRLKPSLADKSADTTEEPSADEARGDAEPPQVRPSASSAPDAQIPARATETILTKASVRSTIAVPAKQPEAVPARAFAAATTAPAVRAPSTLQQQAMAIDTTNTTASREAGARMAVAAPQPSYRLQGPPRANAVTSAPVPAGATSGFQIQVGAFASAGEAERQLATIKSRAGALLHSRPTLALPVRKGDRQLYRARFAGFDANGAANTCLELRRIGVDCFVMRAE